jgi:chemotaxis signal transduction protein
MNASSQAERHVAPKNSFVLFPLGKKRFALPSEIVAELARPDRLQAFPSTTPLLTGVLVRRGRIVPVCDVAPVLIGPNPPTRKFYLIATRRFGAATEWTAIPVTGECELASTEMLPPTGRLPEYVTGLLSIETPPKPGVPASHDIVEVVDLEKLIASHSGAPRPLTEAHS